MILYIMAGLKIVDKSTPCVDEEYIGVSTVKNSLIVERNWEQLNLV